jgi:hypothetical protein
LPSLLLCSDVDTLVDRIITGVGGAIFHEALCRARHGRCSRLASFPSNNRARDAGARAFRDSEKCALLGRWMQDAVCMQKEIKSCGTRCLHALASGWEALRAVCVYVSRWASGLLTECRGASGFACTRREVDTAGVVILPG